MNPSPVSRIPLEPVGHGLSAVPDFMRAMDLLRRKKPVTTPELRAAGFATIEDLVQAQIEAAKGVSHMLAKDNVEPLVMIRWLRPRVRHPPGAPGVLGWRTLPAEDAPRWGLGWRRVRQRCDVLCGRPRVSVGVGRLFVGELRCPSLEMLPGPQILGPPRTDLRGEQVRR